MRGRKATPPKSFDRRLVSVVVAWGAFAGVTIPNVVSTPIIGGQWKQGVSKWPVDFVICENSADPNVPIASTLQPYSG